MIHEAALHRNAGLKGRRVRLHLDPARLWRWQAWLAEDLARAGHSVAVSFTEVPRPLPAAARALLAAERALFRAGGEGACERLDRGAFAAGLMNNPEIVIDLAGDAALHARTVLRAGAIGTIYELPIIAALAARQAPDLLVRSGGVALARAVAASPDPDVIGRGLDAAFSRLGGLLLRAVSGPLGPASPDGKTLSERPTAGGLAAGLGRGFRAKLAAKVGRRLRGGEHWEIGYRFAMPGREAGAYARLDDPAMAVKADPFAIERDGRFHVFYEGVPTGESKGVIRCAALDASGPVEPPRTVLERPYHLSYPFVFERDGAVWMIPETSANRTVELYRADPFPDRWVLEATLMRDVRLADVTLLDEGGQLWMFAASAERRSTDWDALSLFVAPDLLGPWQPHPLNPVLVDARAARPAGAIYREGGSLYRPAQDCSQGYGGAVTLCRIDRLDLGGFAQTAVGRIGPDSHPGWRGVHTLNRAGALELVDGRDHGPAFAETA